MGEAAMEKKKRVCLVTNWYPTKENPYQGVFFKEQALALSDYFDFTVVHYNEKKRMRLWSYVLGKMRGTLYSVSKISEEKNILEYDVLACFPKYKIYTDKLGTFFKKCRRHFFPKQEADCELSSQQKRRKKALSEIFQKYFGDIDVLYCVSPQYESSNLQFIAEALHKPYVISAHAPFPYPGEALMKSEKTAIEHADLFLAISYDKIRQLLLQDIKLKKIGYVGNMVDEDQFTLSAGSGDVKTFLMVAAHSFYKNYDLFIEIFNRLTEITEVPFKVMIVGYGANKGYSQNAEALEKKIENSKFADRAEMIPAVSHSRIHEIYGRADAFVMTSIQEGMPVSALEAGCCGLPIFSTMCGGVEDYVIKEIGRIYKIIDSEAFAQGLKDYLENRMVFDSAAIRSYIVKNYGKKAFTERMASYFNEVIGKD